MILSSEEVKTSTEESVGGVESEQTPQVDDLASIKAEIERLKQTNARLLDESKKYKNQKREVDLKLLEAEGKKDEIIKTLQSELEEKNSSIQKIEEERVRSLIISEVAKRAEKYGCEDWDHLLALGKSELIDYDRELGEVKGIDLFFEDALKNDRFKKFFTKIDKVKTTNSLPNNDTVDWKSDPLPYLMKLKKEGKVSEYNKAILELERSGLLK
jgi:hypothetical protein